MKVPARFRVGVCSHAGLVRSVNEDDYLLASAASPDFLFAGVADGMGGLAGGAEASRTALRAIAAEVLESAAGGDVAAAVAAGFAAAARRVAETSATVPALREMGTTATVLCVRGDSAHVGHVGDSRLYRLRAGAIERLTQDHVVRAPDNRLSRCIGAGRSEVQVDQVASPTAAGDRFVLLSDGAWGALADGVVLRLAGRGDAGAAAEALVAHALAAGSSDNATAVVVDVAAAAADAAGDGFATVALPRDERPDDRSLWPRAGRLPGTAAAWALLAAGALLALHAALRAAGFAGGLIGWPHR
jgi:serine/threonine protein phosphatase PrpC